MTFVQSFIADFVSKPQLVDDDSFALNASRSLAAAPDWDKDSVVAALKRTKSSLFKLNTGLRKAEFMHRLVEQIVRRCRKPMSDTPDNSPGSISQ